MTLAQYDALAERYTADEENQYWRAGVIAATIANVNRDSKRKASAYKPEDFMPQLRKKKQLSQEELIKKVKSTLASFRK